MTHRAVKGMVDFLPADCRLYDYIIQRASSIVKLHGYHRINTPILEYSNVFERSLGEGTDILTKELYKFPDKSNHMVTLRPEGTASVARAMLTNGPLNRTLPQRLYYYGPMFRYENPQKGRLRQFEQFGVEAFGLEHPVCDAEIIGMAWQLIDSLQISSHCRLEVNTIGDTQSRQLYRQALFEFFSAHNHKLSMTSQDRLRNGHVFRILDSKDADDRRLISEHQCPAVLDYLSAEASQRFRKVLELLRVLQIPFVHNQHLVRGLDYYSHTIFEIIHDHNGGEQQLGQSQSTVIAGGRYDGLLERLQSRTLVEDGNQQTPSIGWAAGINRLMMLLADKKLPAEPAPVLLIFLAPSDGLRQSLIIQYGLQLAQQLRTSDISVSFAAELLPSSASEKLPSSSKQLTRLLRRCSTQPKYALFIGDAELDSQTITVKDLIASKQQPLVSIKQFIAAANSRRPIDA